MHGSNVYRGHIYLHLNYLILRALFKFNTGTEQLYRTLKDAITKTVLQEWEATHSFWEGYSQSDGTGIGTKGFASWTSLIILIMTDSYH